MPKYCFFQNLFFRNFLRRFDRDQTTPLALLRRLKAFYAKKIQKISTIAEGVPLPPYYYTAPPPKMISNIDEKAKMYTLLCIDFTDRLACKQT